ncbi:MAG: uroporphyrinogen decarboxylase family protein [Candidatus Helarchaeota archaeon]
MREDAIAALYHEEIPKQVPLYDIRFDEFIIKTMMNTKSVTVETEIACLRKLGFSMITAHPLTLGKKETRDPVTGRKGYIDEWGREYSYVNGIKFYKTGRLQEQDLENRNWDPAIETRYTNIKEVLQKADDFAIIGRVGGTFERALLSIGPERFFTAIYNKPKLLKKFIERINNYWIEIGKREIELGVDAILLTDDLAYHSGPYLSPHHMEEFIWPTFRKRLKAFQKIPIILHSDGNINSLLDSIVKIGLNGIHSLEPTAGMDIGRVKNEYGDKLVLLGNIDCGQLLTHGTEAQVMDIVKRTIIKAAPGGGYFLSTSNGVHRAVKVKNLFAMVRACKKYGKYPIKT